MKRLHIFLKDFGLWLYWYPCRFILSLLPRKLHMAMATMGGYLLYHLARNTRGQLIDLLLFLYGPGGIGTKELQDVARRSFVHDVKRRGEELLMGKMSRKDCSRLVAMEGQENLELARAAGKGTILLLSHYGSFLLNLPALGFAGYPVKQVGGPPELKGHRSIHRRIFSLRKQMYEQLPIMFLRTDLHLRGVLTALRLNEVVALALDGREGANWQDVEFFGRRASFSAGPLKLAQRTGAAIVPTYIVRQADDTHRVYFEPPIFPQHITDRQRVLQGLVSLFERNIRIRPCHFAMILYIIEQKARHGVVGQPIFSRNHHA